jgi:branched-chain amino acid aminotransferase
MLKDRLAYVNGEFVAWENATVHLMCHSFARGSAVFEVLSLHATAAGPAVFRLREHIERLCRSTALLEMELPLSKEALHQSVIGTVRRNRLEKGVIKILCFFPQFSLEILPPQKKLDIAIFVLDPFHDLEEHDLPANIMEKGTTACISKWRKLDPQTVPVQAKAAANYLNGMMARTEATQRGFENAIMLDTQGFIAEGGTESVFLVKGGRLFTPALGTVLGSITRKSILEAARTIGIETGEERLDPQMLFEADEIFFASTTLKVFPVRQIEHQFLDETPGPLTRKLAELMDNISGGKDERFNHWLDMVG